MADVTFEDILAARQRIAGGVLETPCAPSAALSELCECEIFCKLEFLQRTGSFKERGARNALLLLEESQRRRGVVAASAGNHALALAWHGRDLGVPVTVVMPRFAPLVKQANCRKFGAEVVLCGDSFGEAKAKADELAAAHGLTYVHGYNDAAIIAGAGTLGIEIIDQVGDADAVIVPVGGGGLLAGVAPAVKHLSPMVQVIGVEAAALPSFTASREAAHVVSVPASPTLADGLAVGKVGERAFAIAQPLVEKVLTAPEEMIALSVARFLEIEKCVVEGAGGISLAPLLSRQLPELRGKKVILLLTGGNIDLTILPRLIDAALVKDGRLARFTAVISDRPGGLAQFTAVLAQCGASVKEIVHDRIFSGPNVAAVNVFCTIETRDHAHQEEIFQALAQAGFRHFAHEGSPSPPAGKGL
jgi:threonine dehydratase